MIASTAISAARSDASEIALFTNEEQPAAFSVSTGNEWLLGSPPSPPAPHYRIWLPNLLLAGAVAGVSFGTRPPRDARWADRNSFDEGIRDGLAGASRSTRAAAETATDVLFAALGVGLVADHMWLRHEYPSLRSLGVDSSWLLANQLATDTAKLSAGRRRPYVRPCRANPEYVGDCHGGRSDNASFYSGHASWTATLAGLLCARHLHRTEVSAVDYFVCGGAVGAGVATGLLRITAEQHYASDIFAAWGAGAVFGYILPVWFDYGSRPPHQATVQQSVQPLLGTRTIGLTYALRF